MWLTPARMLWISLSLVILDKFSAVRKLGQKNTRRMSMDGSSWISDASSSPLELKTLAYLERVSILRLSTTSVVINKLGFGKASPVFFVITRLTPCGRLSQL